MFKEKQAKLFIQHTPYTSTSGIGKAGKTEDVKDISAVDMHATNAVRLYGGRMSEGPGR